MNKLNNKWCRGVIPALLIHLSIGSVYAWSLLSKPIAEYIGQTQSSVQFAFSLAIFFLGMSAAFGGRLVEKNVSKSSLMSTIFFISGLLITGLSVYLKSLIGIYIGYGCIMGIGLGIGYLTPIKTLMLWFDKQKGLATGIAIMGFGFGSAIASPIISSLCIAFDLPIVFVSLTVIYTIPMILAHFLIKKPIGYKENTEKSDFKSIKMFKNLTFIFIWIMIYINISCGLSLISIASPLMNEYNIGLTVITTIVAVMGIFNGVGRLGFSTLSDKFKNRTNIYILIFLISLISVFVSKIYPQTICVTLIIISACYGAGFSCLPSLLSDKFGITNISKIHGLSLTAWAMAGLTGNQVSELVKNITGSYSNVLIILMVCYSLGMIISTTMSKTQDKKKEEYKI